MLTRGCLLVPVDAINQDQRPSCLGSATGHVEAHLSRFWIEPGLKGGGISTDTLVPVPEPGLKALTNPDYRPFFYQCLLSGLGAPATWRPICPGFGLNRD